MAQFSSRRELLAGLPPEPDEYALFPEIRRRVAEGRRKLVVIDDDPTGVQTVHDVSLYLSWNQKTLADALQRPENLFFLLTNSRSMTGADAALINASTAYSLAQAAAQTGVDFVIASRSDSTLRGHYPGEVQALQSALGKPLDAHLLVPAFFEGGRYTIGDTHYVAVPDATSDNMIPADQTPFAQDKVFGYRSAYLPAWVQEKSAGAILRTQVDSLSLELIRTGGAEAVAEKLNTITGGVPVIVNAAGYGDLAVVVLGVLMAEAAGKNFLYRTAAGFVRLRGAVGSIPVLSASEILGSVSTSAGGLVVVGSHVPASSAQLEMVLALPGIEGIELSVEAAANSDEESIRTGRATGQRVEQVVRSGCTAVLYTSRGLLTGGTAAMTLAIGRRVADALVTAVCEVATCPRFLVAKGGITSHVIAQQGLGADRARAIGQVLPGVPVWRLESGPDLRFPGIPYIVFPGNVGGPNSLADVIQNLTQN